ARRAARADGVREARRPSRRRAARGLRAIPIRARSVVHAPPGATAATRWASVLRIASRGDAMRHTPPEFLDLTSEMRERLEKFRTEHAGDPLGKVANHVLYEDDDVRVWEMILQPGE